MNFTNRLQAAATAALLATLAACGGGGGGGDGSTGGGSAGGTSSSGGSSGTSKHVLFASDDNGNLAAFSVLAPTAGTSIAADIVANVPGGGRVLAWDSTRDELYDLVSVPGSTPQSAIVVFGNASAMAAGAAPARTLVLSDFTSLEAMYLDTANDTLWVGGLVSGRGWIEVFQHASTLSGTVVPDRTLVTVDDVRGLAVDSTRSKLYQLTASSTVMVYDSALTLNGDVTASRFIYGGQGSNVSLDPGRDILYATGSAGSVTAVHNASAASPGPNVSFTLPGSISDYTAIVDPAHDRLYVGAAGGAFVYDNASLLTSSSSSAGVEALAPNDVVFGFAF